VRQNAKRWIAGLALTSACLLMGAADPDKDVLFSGCAMPLADNPSFLTLCEPHACSLLRGPVDLRLAGHAVKLKGVLHEATSTQPRTIEVHAVLHRGGACKAVCKPEIPGRGLHKDHPDSEGGTPGVHPTIPPER
jgi:hypothetical protein